MTLSFLITLALAGPLDDLPGEDTGAEEIPEEEQLPDDLELVRERQVVDDRRANRGRIAVLAGAEHWHIPGPTSGLTLQVHAGPNFALHFEGGASLITLLTPGATGRTTVALPGGALGLVVDPVQKGRVRPQAALEATGTIWQTADTGEAFSIAPGGRARIGIDLKLAGPLNFSAEGALGLRAAPALPELVNPRWSVVSSAATARGGLVMRW